MFFLLLVLGQTAFAASGFHCDLQIDSKSGPLVESKKIWSGDLYPYRTLYVDPRTSSMRDCKTPTLDCVGTLYVKMSSGVSGGSFFHIGRVTGFQDGIYDMAADITVSDLSSELHLTYWRENSFIVDCKKL